jgi:ketosteroid isomerase-like protein
MPDHRRTFTAALIVLATMAARVPLAEAQVRPVVQSTAERDQMQYNAEMMGDFQDLVRDWREAVIAGNIRAAAGLYADNAVLVPAAGELAQGNSEVEAALTSISREWRNLRIGLLDFEASGSLLYGLGTYVYDTGVGAEATTVTGTYVLVLRRTGRHLRIRSQTFHPPYEPGGESAPVAGDGG